MYSRPCYTARRLCWMFCRMISKKKYIFLYKKHRNITMANEKKTEKIGYVTLKMHTP